MIPETEYTVRQGKHVGSEVSVTVGEPIKKYQTELKGIRLYINLKVKDSNENIIEERVEQGNSFLLNFMRMLYAVLTVSSYNDFVHKGVVRSESTDFLGDTVTVQYTVDGFHAWAPKEFDTHGIVVGTGETMVTPDDQELEAQIANGIGAGKMVYLFSDIVPTAVTATEAYIILRRSFINHSGGSITVKELGVIVWVVGTDKYKLIIRDLISPITVNNDYTLDVQYVIVVTV